jgi:hypothetical protein
LSTSGFCPESPCTTHARHGACVLAGAVTPVRPCVPKVQKISAGLHHVRHPRIAWGISILSCGP